VQEAKTYRQYAAECRRIAETMGATEKDALLRIAMAWDERALDAERAAKKKDGDDR